MELIGRVGGGGGGRTAGRALSLHAHVDCLGLGGRWFVFALLLCIVESVVE